jgi:flagellin
MEIAKNNILKQSQENLLNQSNKMPESILNLMKQFEQS